MTNIWDAIFWDVKDSDEAYNMTCNSCGGDGSEFAKQLREKWNEDLETVTFKICNMCGQTTDVTRKKDEPGAYNCTDCRRPLSGD